MKELNHVSVALFRKIRKPFSVLFLCLNNIYRSPTTEGAYIDVVKKRGLDSKFKIDSVGTINYYEGPNISKWRLKQN